MRCMTQEPEPAPEVIHKYHFKFVNHTSLSPHVAPTGGVVQKATGKCNMYGDHGVRWSVCEVAVCTSVYVGKTFCNRGVKRPTLLSLGATIVFEYK
jgi:hypothetical protein